MSRLNVWWLSGVIFTVVLTGLAVYPLGIRSAQAEYDAGNPRIHHALEALHGAEAELRDAPHDFHGHKQRALEAVRHAIEELDVIKDWHE
jgi:hypothetical protein